MKISFVEPHLKLYGGIRRIIELSNRLVLRGHDVTIFHSDGSPCEWLKCIAKIKSYNMLLNEVHDVVIYNDPNPIDYRLVKKAKAKIKILYVLELYQKEMLKRRKLRINRSKKRRMLILEKSLCSSYFKLSNASWERKWLRENMNIDSEILFGGVNTEMFHPVHIKRNLNEIRILCSGDPRERKGTKTILKAVEIAKKYEPHIVLDSYYGKGLLQDKMAEKYSSADMFLEASWHAGWNNPVAESMACKVPVICTEIGGVRDFAIHEKTALLVPVKNSEAMAAAILRLIKDRKLKEKIVENAYQHIRQFDWDKSAERLEEILKYQLEKRKKDKKNIVKKFFKILFNPNKFIKKQKIKFKKKLLINRYFEKNDKFGPYHWHTYGKDLIYKEHVDYILDSFEKKSKGSLLDVGCGDGFISNLLSESGFQVIGIDTEKTAIRMAREKCLSATFEVNNIFNMNGQFDYLIASEIIEHVATPECFFRKIRNMFKVEALITTPKINYYKKIDPHHVQEYNIYEFESLLEKYFKNFKIDNSENHLYGWIIK